MDLLCPRCGSRSNELLECENCGTIGCIRCVQKKHGKWVCFKCEEPEKKYYYSDLDNTKEDEVTNAFSAMFG
jgi:hypothetical protein